MSLDTKNKTNKNPDENGGTAINASEDFNLQLSPQKKRKEKRYTQKKDNKQPNVFCFKWQDSTDVQTSSLTDEFYFGGHGGRRQREFSRTQDGFSVGPVGTALTSRGCYAEATAAPRGPLAVGQTGVEDVDGLAVDGHQAAAHRGLCGHRQDEGWVID